MNVLVIGSNREVTQELEWLNREAFDAIVGVNRAAVDFGPVDYHCTLHPEVYATCKAGRMIANRPYRGVDRVLTSLWTHGGVSGSSGLFGVKFALECLRAECVVLAGIHISETPHYYNPSEWHAAKRFQSTWREVLPRLKGRVFSMGGWTARLLNSGDPLEQPELRQFIIDKEASHV